MRRHLFISICALVSSLLLPLSANATEESKGVGVTVADEWVSLVDEAQYWRTWDEASAYFRSVITAERWEEAVRQVRDPLGPVHSRQMTSAVYSNTLPNAPKGEYVVIKYATEFANRSSNVETITVMMEDNQWKVTGYFVK